MSHVVTFLSYLGCIGTVDERTGVARRPLTKYFLTCLDKGFVPRTYIIGLWMGWYLYENRYKKVHYSDVNKILVHVFFQL